MSRPDCADYLPELVAEHEANIGAWRQHREDGDHLKWDTFSWNFGITHPGGFGRDHSAGLELVTEVPHYVTILSRWPSWHDTVDRLMYRGACLACGWVSDGFYYSGNEATEAAHHHGWRGWRELPSIERGDPMQGGKLKPAAQQIYEEEYLLPRWGDRPSLLGAPVLTERRKGGTRHVPMHNPWKGYDMWNGVLTQAAEPVGAQAALF